MFGAVGGVSVRGWQQEDAGHRCDVCGPWPGVALGPAGGGGGGQRGDAPPPLIEGGVLAAVSQSLQVQPNGTLQPATIELSQLTQALSAHPQFAAHHPQLAAGIIVLKAMLAEKQIDMSVLAKQVEKPKSNSPFRFLWGG